MYITMVEFSGASRKYYFYAFFSENWWFQTKRFTGLLEPKLYIGFKDWWFKVCNYEHNYKHKTLFLLFCVVTTSRQEVQRGRSGVNSMWDGDRVVPGARPPTRNPSRSTFWCCRSVTTSWQDRWAIRRTSHDVAWGRTRKFLCGGCGDCTANALRLHDVRTISAQPLYGFTPACPRGPVQEMARCS